MMFLFSLLTLTEFFLLFFLIMLHVFFPNEPVQVTRPTSFHDSSTWTCRHNLVHQEKIFLFGLKQRLQYIRFTLWSIAVRLWTHFFCQTEIENQSHRKFISHVSKLIIWKLSNVLSKAAFNVETVNVKTLYLHTTSFLLFSVTYGMQKTGTKTKNRNKSTVRL